MFLEEFAFCDLGQFKKEKFNIYLILFTEEVNKILLSANDDKRIQSIDPIDTYAYRTNKDLLCKEVALKVTL